MLVYCGVNCQGCSGYRGTVEGDVSLLEKLAAKLWDGAYSAADWVCLGCLPADQPILSRYCSQCRIRSCAIGRGISNCAVCPDYEHCSLLHDFIAKEGEEVVRTMALLRERYLAAQRQSGRQD